jgi:hypothetical protein
MSGVPPALPVSKPSLMAPWLCWIAACVLLPASPLLLGGQVLKSPGTFVLLLALMVQVGCSVWVPIILAMRSRKGAGFVVGTSLALIVASVVVGALSFFVTCVIANPHIDWK